ncbi:SDR family NAD(P)-dependent oxidoreductase [Gryllotalpicola reticulitermitis]|uniref:SDR family NAD(P)-dependent oxidoreductase n=1 Tax=Gryllotalpicola reticulitermitis TaxID=1184153 RepID=A0ABV8QAH9_9MICO
MTSFEQPDFSIRGQRALVTGAARGIGHDLALALALAGADVLAGVRRESDGDELAAATAGGRDAGTITPFVLDVTDVSATRAAIDAEVAARGAVQILVNNAGLGFNHDAVDVGEDDWDAMMDVNLKGLFFVTQAVARHMLAAEYGRVVNLSSQAGLVGIRRHAVYSASKGGVNLLTKVLALEWANRGVTVNAVAPTYIYTPGTAERLDQPEIAADILARIPAERFGTTTDVAAAMLYFASPSAGLVTGTILPVDGGWTAQ